MSHELILQSINKIVELNAQEKKYFSSLLEVRRVKKREVLFHAGEVHQHTAFVNEGCLRSFSLDSNGFEHIVQFAPAGWWIADIASLTSNEPAHLSIDALLDSEVVLLKRSAQEKLFLKYPCFERFFRIILEKSIAAHHNRLMDYMGLSAAEQYDNFCKRYPGLISALPQKQIAAYIGVTPEFLSKMKAELLKRPKKK